MRSQLIYFKSRQFSGTRSALRWWKNAQETEVPARGFVWLLHGVGEHSERYSEMATFLTQFGFDVLCPDWPGHGMSALSGGQKKLADFPSMIHELENIFDEWNKHGPLAEKNVRQKPWFLFGHSMGALLALMWILKGKASAESPDFALRAFVSGPPLALSMPVPAWKSMLSQKLAQWAPHMKIPSGLSPDQLSFDAANVQAYQDDPLVSSTVTPHWYESMLNEAERVLAHPADIEIPLCIALGEEDSVCDPKTTQKYYETLKTQKRLILNSGKKHEIFNEFERREIFEALVSWFL